MASSTPTRNCEIIAGVPRSKVNQSPPITPNGSPNTGVISGILGNRRGYWNNIWDFKTGDTDKDFADEQLFGHDGFTECEEVVTAQFLQRRRSSSGSIDSSISEQFKVGSPDTKLGPISEQVKKQLGNRKAV